MTKAPMHVLLVDDDDVTNFLSKEMLRLFMGGPKVDIALNGQEAIDYLVAHSNTGEVLPDLILLDINMPIMDGWDFLAEFDRIKQPGFENITIIMLTSSVYFEDIERAKTYPTVKQIYSKPLDEGKIREIVQACGY